MRSCGIHVRAISLEILNTHPWYWFKNLRLQPHLPRANELTPCYGLKELYLNIWIVTKNINTTSICRKMYFIQNLHAKYLTMNWNHAHTRLDSHTTHPRADLEGSFLARITQICLVILDNLHIHNCSEPVFYLWLSKVSANKRRRYICNVFSNWLRPCSAVDRKQAPFWPDWMNKKNHCCTWISSTPFWKGLQMSQEICFIHQRFSAKLWYFQ